LVVFWNFLILESPSSVVSGMTSYHMVLECCCVASSMVTDCGTLVKMIK
jgi:hypothetical protein